MEQINMSIFQPKTVVFLFKAPKDGGKDKYQEILEREEIISVVVPVLSFHFINQEILKSALLCHDKYSAIILTSVRAVDAVVEALKSTDQVTPAKLSTLQCFVVGLATQEAAQKVGFSPEGGQSGNAEALAEFIIENLKDSTKPLLFPCSSIHRESLPDFLSHKGLQLDEVVSYETCVHENLAESLKSNLSAKGAPDFVVFFSPSGFNFVHDVMDTVPLSLKDTKILALGPATCQAIQDKGLTPYGKADKPEPQSLLHLIQKTNSPS